jgi:hypothetical protein
MVRGKMVRRRFRTGGKGNAMMVYRALLAVAIVGLAIPHAGAQFGGMPGMPGAPGADGGGFSPPPQAPPPQCQELLHLRDALQKHGHAIETANQRKATVKVACQLFRNYLATEAKMILALDKNGPSCGVPPQVNKQVRDSHAKAGQIGKQVCDAAARGPAGPSLSDALGTAPPLPDAQKKGAGTFDTLTGNPFAK